MGVCVSGAVRAWESAGVLFDGERAERAAVGPHEARVPHGLGGPRARVDARRDEVVARGDFGVVGDRLDHRPELGEVVLL